MTQLTTPEDVTVAASVSAPATGKGDPASADHVIRCARLTKVFKDFWMRDRVTAVKGIDLDVRRGEVFGLLGPNGSGKSTTIKMILGLLHPTSGVVSVFGRPARDVSVKKRIGYLPEESYLYRFLNARETLEYYGKLFHQDRRKRQQRIDMLLEMVGLDKVQRRPIGEYSKGMQRRIGLAQALINDPQLLILDEPTTGLDPIGTRQIKDLILRLRDTGKTVLLCSHLLSDVEDVTDRAAIMFGGKVRRSGTITELLQQEDQTTVTMPSLSEVDTERLVAGLEAMGITEARVTRSRQKLESLFLEIVHQAQAEGVQTAGAGNAGRVAAFLTAAEGAAGAASADGEAAADAGRVLDALTQSPADAAQTPEPNKTASTGPEPPGSPGAAQPDAEPDQGAVADDDLLAGLAAAPGAGSGPPPAEPNAPADPVGSEPERGPAESDAKTPQKAPQKAPDVSVLDELTGGGGPA
ncbi:MAG: ABC transporter ATP-binding protein [Planctomycetota bacterium]